MKYRVLDFVWARPEQLEVHPEAKVPIAEEDAAALKASVEDGGMIQPLLVMKKSRVGRVKKWWIVDGANRFKALQGVERIPCVVVMLEAGTSVRDLALECASVGRSRSAGQRIMVYLERHKEKVLAASEKGQILKNGYFAAPALSRESAVDSKGFSSKEIAKALGVSQQDTLLAIELMTAHEKRTGLSSVVGGLKEEGKKLEDSDPEMKAIDETWAGVLAGTTPIRRMRAAVGGKTATKEVRRAEVSWYDVGKKALASLRGLGGHWEGLAMEDRMELLQLVREVSAALPREVRDVLAGGSR